MILIDHQHGVRNVDTLSEIDVVRNVDVQAIGKVYVESASLNTATRWVAEYDQIANKLREALGQNRRGRGGCGAKHERTLLRILGFGAPNAPGRKARQQNEQQTQTSID